MALLRPRSRYGRLLALAVILTGLYYLSSQPAASGSGLSSSFSISAVSMLLPWSKHHSNTDAAAASFEVPERPRPKMSTPPLSRKHKTRNGRPARVGPGAPGGKTLGQIERPRVDEVLSADRENEDKMLLFEAENKQQTML